MKKAINILIIFAFTTLLLITTNKSNSEYMETNDNSNSENFTLQWSIPMISASEDGFTVSSKYLYNDGLGYGWILCTQTGTYQFKASGTITDIYSNNSADIIWKVYLLDQPFIDSPRFIPQAGYEPSLIGDGSVKITEGTYIVIYCSQNSYEYGLSHDGDPDACYKCQIEK